MSRFSMITIPGQWAASVACQAEESLRGIVNIPFLAPAYPNRPFPILLATIAAAGYYGGSATVRAIRTCVLTNQNNTKREKKREACSKSIEDLRARLAAHPMKKEQVEKITKMTLVELTGHLQARTLRPLQVLRAFQTKALEAHEKTNCLVEFIHEAEEWAKALEDGPRGGMLYGIPISIKDDVPIKGYDSTLGCIELADRPVQDDTCIIKVLRGIHGAIPFVKTNVPQTELTFEPGNPINGPVFNPHNTAHGPGGSSSGEGALIAAGGSILGIGSDIGGSICVPSHFCGICGFKPTHQRVSRLGSLNSLAFQSPICSAYGPMARDVDSLVFAMKALWDGYLNNLDVAALPMPFNSLVYEDKSKLRIGYYLHDGMFPLFQGCARAVLMAKTALELKGHKLVAWTPPDITQALELYCRILQADSVQGTMKALEHDLIAQSLKPILYIHKVPRFLRWLFAKLIWPFRPTLSTMVDCTLGQPDVHSYWRVCRQLNEYCQMVHDSWKEHKLDAVICPPFAFAAPPLGNPFLSTQGATFGIVYNCLNFPTGVVRMTKVKQEDIDSLGDFPSDNPFHRAAKHAMEKALGLPMGVMVIALRYHDEKCLRTMKDIESAAEFTVV